MADLQKTVEAHLTTGRSFRITTGSGHQVVLDAAPESGGNNEGARPTELLLAALAGCAGIGIIGILRKMRQDVTDYAIHVSGEMNQDQPATYTSITVEHIFTGHSLQATAVERAIDLDRERYCSVNAILGASAPIRHIYQIRDASFFPKDDIENSSVIL